jgi:pilus assembly protein CpaF
VISISEVTGMDTESNAMQDIFVFERRAIDENGKVRGVFRATGVKPHFADRLATYGSRLRPALFESRTEI